MTLDLTIPSYWWEGCTVDDGTKLKTYDFLCDLMDALYKAMTLEVNVMAYLGHNDVYITFPSKHVVYLWKDGQVPDFRLQRKKFWAVKLTIFGAVGLIVPLPKIAIDPKISLWWNRALTLPGSENWDYKDDDGVVKKGINCTEPRGYNLITDGLDDAGLILLFLIICIIIGKLSINLLSRFIQSITNMRVINYEKDILGKVDKILSLLEPSQNVASYDIEDTLNEIKSLDLNEDEELASVKRILGVKLQI